MKKSEHIERPFDLYLGDCLTMLQAVPDKSVDLILCDPPYGTTACANDEVIPFDGMWGLYERVLKPTGCVVLFGSQPFTSRLVVSNLDWFRYSLVWNKNKCGSPGLAKFRPMKVHEDILVFSPGRTIYNPQMEAGEPYSRKPPKQIRCNHHGYGFAGTKSQGIINTGTRYPKSVLNISRDFSAQQQIHPHQKPVTLMRWLVRTYSNPGDVVLDNAFGSCSTGVACREEGRVFVGCEINPDHVAIAVSRIGADRCTVIDTQPAANDNTNQMDLFGDLAITQI